MSVTRQQVSLPYVAGINDGDAAGTRLAPTLAEAVDVVPGRRGSLVTRDGLRRHTLTVRDEAVGTALAYTQGLHVDTDGANATIWCNGRVHRLDETIDRQERPRYSEVTWTTDDIAEPLLAETAPLRQSAVLRYTDARGSSWVVVAQALHYTAGVGGTPIRLVLRWYCDGAEVYRYPIQDTYDISYDSWRLEHRNQVALDAHIGLDGAADYVLVGVGTRTDLGDSGPYGWKLLRFAADDPAAGAAAGYITPTTGDVSSWDIVGCNTDDGDDYWAVAYGTSTGEAYVQWLGVDMVKRDEDVVTDTDADPVVAVRIARSTGQSANDFGVGLLKQDATYRFWGAVVTRGSGSVLRTFSQETISAGEYITHIDVAAHDEERFVYAASRADINAGTDFLEAWTDFWVCAESSGTCALLRESRIYWAGGVALATLERGRAVAVLRDPGFERSSQRYVSPVRTGYSASTQQGSPHYGRAVMVELGDLTESGGYGADYWRAHMVCGAVYQGEAWELARGRHDPGARSRGGYVGVVRSDVLLDPFVNFAYVNGSSYTSGAVGLVSLETAAQYDVATAPGVTVCPGGAPTGYPTHYAAATLGYPVAPRASAANAAESGTAPAGTGYYRCIYRRWLPNGQSIVSEPSNVCTVVHTGANAVDLDCTPTCYGPNIGETEIVWYYSDDGVAFNEIAPRYSEAKLKNDPTAAYLRLKAWYSSAPSDVTSNRLYTDAGVLDAWLPPSATQAIHWQRRVWLCGGHRELWYSREIVSGEAPAWHPALVVTIGRQRITGCQPLGERLVVWTETGTYLLAGDGPSDNGAGGFQQPALLYPQGLRLGDTHKTASGRAGVWWWGTDDVLRRVGLDGSVTDHHPWDDGPSTSYLTPEVMRITSSERTGDVRVQYRWEQTGAGQYVLCYHEDAQVWTQVSKTGEFPVGDAFAQPLTAVSTMYCYLRRPGETCDSAVSSWGGTPTLTALSPVVRMTGLTFDGALGHQRLYAVEPMWRTSELWQWYVELDSDGYGDEVTGTGKASTATVQPDYGIYTGAPNAERFQFSRDAAGGLWAARIRAGVARGQSADVTITGIRLGYAPGGSGSPVALTATEPRQEFVALGVEYGKRPGRGRGADSANG